MTDGEVVSILVAVVVAAVVAATGYRLRWRRLVAAWHVLRGRPFELVVPYGKHHGPPPMRRDGLHQISIARLSVPTDREDLLLSIGCGGWLLDGKEFPWATVDAWVLRVSDDDVTTLTISLPVLMAGGTPS